MLGDGRAFFSIYRVFADAGAKVYQLDRYGLPAGFPQLHQHCVVHMNHTSAPGSQQVGIVSEVNVVSTRDVTLMSLCRIGRENRAQSAAEVAQIALRSVDCILATYEQCSAEGFPWLSFDSIVPYTPLPTDFAFPTLANGCQVVSFHVEWEREPHVPHQARLQTTSSSPGRTTRPGPEAQLAGTGQPPLVGQTPLTRQLFNEFRTPLCAGIPCAADMSRVPAHSAENQSCWTAGGSAGPVQEDAAAAARAQGTYPLCPGIPPMRCLLQYEMSYP